MHLAQIPKVLVRIENPQLTEIHRPVVPYSLDNSWLGPLRTAVAPLSLGTPRGDSGGRIAPFLSPSTAGAPIADFALAANPERMALISMPVSAPSEIMRKPC